MAMENALRFLYKNYRSEVYSRRVIPITVGVKDLPKWYPGGPTLFLTGYDLDKRAVRDFCFFNIQSRPYPIRVLVEEEWHHEELAHMTFDHPLFANGIVTIGFPAIELDVNHAKEDSALSIRESGQVSLREGAAAES